MRRSSILTGKVVTGLVAVFFLASSTTIANATHSWGKYHWARTTNSFTLQLGDNLTTADWKVYLGEASTQWSTSEVLDTTVVVGAKKGNCGAVSGRVEVCNAKYGSNGWLGIASIWASGSHITQGTVKLNDTYFNKPQYKTPSLKRLVMCQELGHTLGLDHTNEDFTNVNDGTCMDYTNAPDGGGTYGPSNVAPNQHDYNQLGLIYAHPDSTTTIRSTTTSTGKNIVGDLNDPSAWGRPIGDKDSRGRNSHFELDLGKGQKLFTFVVWADN
jgi:hypothetical protein